jgi:hypothetical protein
MQSTAGVGRPSAAKAFFFLAVACQSAEKRLPGPPLQHSLLARPATTLAAGVLQALLRDQRQQVKPVWATKSLRFGLSSNSCISCKIRLVGEAVQPLEMSLEETLL